MFIGVKEQSIVNYRIVDKPAFDVVGKRTWISGQDNELFGRFWTTSAAENLFDLSKWPGGFAIMPASLWPNSEGLLRSNGTNPFRFSITCKCLAALALSQ